MPSIALVSVVCLVICVGLVASLNSGFEAKLGYSSISLVHLAVVYLLSSFMEI